MFASFEQFDLPLGDVRIHGVHSGVHRGVHSGLHSKRPDNARPPLLLLHGYPQSHLIWHKVAPALAERFTVIAPDLRGYGGSSKPIGAADHSNYSKRVMARDQVEVMAALGYEQFFVCGHDRGGRVAHRMALDHPQAVKKLMVLDISPTLTMYEETSMEFALGYWWWFFLVQPSPFPEKLIAASPEVYLEKKIAYGKAGRTPFTAETYAAYLRSISDPETLHGMCEDYRASAGIDLAHDRADREAGKKVTCPTRVLWGEHGVVHRCFHPLEDWRKFAINVSGEAVPAGHYIPEEIPARLSQELISFFA